MKKNAAYELKGRTFDITDAVLSAVKVFSLDDGCFAAGSFCRDALLMLD